MIVSAWLATISPKDRDAFAVSLLRAVQDTEAGEPTDDATAQANSWVRALVAEIVGSPKAP